MKNGFLGEDLKKAIQRFQANLSKLVSAMKELMTGKIKTEADLGLTDLENQARELATDLKKFMAEFNAEFTELDTKHKIVDDASQVIITDMENALERLQVSTEALLRELPRFKEDLEKTLEKYSKK